MIRCKSCASSNLIGAIFCGECGALLPEPPGSELNHAAPGLMARMAFSRGAVRLSAAPAGDSWATLHMLDSGRTLPLTGSDEFTMGRRTEGQTTPPDIDLSADDAFSSGVSRRHAMIRRNGNRIILQDLDSANGTYVNGKRLSPHQQERLTNGDVIALGRLKIQIRLKTV